MSVRNYMAGSLVLLLAATASRADIVVQNGPPLDINALYGVHYVPAPFPAGTLLDSVDHVITQSYIAPYADLSSPVPAFDEVPETATYVVRNSVVRQTDGTLAFVYQLISESVDREPGKNPDGGLSVASYRAIATTGFDGGTVDFDYIERISLPSSVVTWNDDTIALGASHDDVFQDFAIHTDATTYDTSGTFTMNVNFFKNPSPVLGRYPIPDQLTEAGFFAPTGDDATPPAIPLPPALVPALATMVGAAGVLVRRHRAMTNA